MSEKSYKWMRAAIGVMAVVLIVLIILVCVLFSYVRVDREFEGYFCYIGDYYGVSSGLKVRGITDFPGEMVRVYYSDQSGYECYVADVKEDELWIYVDNGENGGGYYKYSQIK